jgi:hypothetical protein
MRGMEIGYNERLFAGGFRQYLHESRFRWVSSAIRRHKVPLNKLIELGCFDARLLEYVEPAAYVGIDANWEGGVPAARRKIAGRPDYAIVETTSPNSVADLPGHADLGVALETLEHLPPETVPKYLADFAGKVDWLLVSVPNEKGPLFLTKWLFKRLVHRDGTADPYTIKELIGATLGKMSWVARDEHKGFDYAVLLRQVGERFQVVEVRPLPFPWLPAALSFGVGIVARKR